MNKFLDEPIQITLQKWDLNTIPLVSISCITYNQEKYIRDAIDGFLMQKTTFPVEILIHDDASTDKTANIVREYEAKYPNLIKPIYQTENQYSKHNGVIGCTQRGRAVGKYYATCEGDDYWTDPLKLQKQVDFLEQNQQYVFCGHQYRRLNEFDNTFSNSPSFEWYKNTSSFEINTDVLFNIWPVSTLSMVIRTEAVKKVANVSTLFNYFCDVHLFYYLLKEGKGMALNEIMAVRRVHQGGVSGGLDPEKFVQTAYNIHKELYKYNKNERALKQKYFYNLLKLQCLPSIHSKKRIQLLQEGISIAYKEPCNLIRLIRCTLKGVIHKRQ